MLRTAGEGLSNTIENKVVFIGFYKGGSLVAQTSRLIDRLVNRSRQNDLNVRDVRPNPCLQLKPAPSSHVGKDNPHIQVSGGQGRLRFLAVCGLMHKKAALPQILGERVSQQDIPFNKENSFD